VYDKDKKWGRCEIFLETPCISATLKKLFNDNKAKEILEFTYVNYLYIQLENW
jgi:hypothetical protein